MRPYENLRQPLFMCHCQHQYGKGSLQVKKMSEHASDASNAYLTFAVGKPASRVNITRQPSAKVVQF